MGKNAGFLFVAIIYVLAGFSGTALAGSAPPEGLSVPVLKEEATAAGLVHQYTGPWEFFVGGGVASFDCNGDRRADVFIAGGASPAQLFVNSSKPGGALRFSPKDLAVKPALLTKATGAYPLNIDNDDYMDIVVLRLGKNLLLQGGPDCTFTPANAKFGFEGGDEWTTGFSAIWEKGARFPTLAFGNYVDRKAEGAPFGTCNNNYLYRPAKGDTALPDYSMPTALKPGYCSLSMLFTNWNGSGEPALRIANDRQYYRGGEEQLWRVPAGAPVRLFSTSDGWKKLNIWGMGIAETDLNNDGMPEYVLSSMGDTKLQVLDASANGRPTYGDLAFKKQMTAHRPYTGDNSKPSTGWHVQFADFNNDAIADLFIAKGNVEAMPMAAMFDPDNMLLGGADGMFHEAGKEAGIALDRRGRGAVIEDFNLDGKPDLLVVNRAANISLFRNMGTKSGLSGNWLSIELSNGKINRQAVGAKIIVKTAESKQSKTIQIGGGHASGQSGPVHFGLGKDVEARVQIVWPDGETSREYAVKANRFAAIERGMDAVSYREP